MKILIIYDSVFGNTEQIALAIGNVFANLADVAVLKVSDVKPDRFAGLKLLIIGSPTQRFRPTVAINNLLKAISTTDLKGVKVTAFDTRLTMGEINKIPILAFFVRMFGYAAKPIADRLEKKGGALIIPPEGFFVDGMEGPLVHGEIERAMNWAKEIRTKLE